MKGEIMASGTTTDQAEKTAQELQEDKTSGTYDAGCHCGYSKFSVTLTPALPETKVLSCNCSACTRFGYLLVYPEASSVTWHNHNDSRARCSNYRFNTKEKDQMFCEHCGASIGIDFREVYAPKHIYGISVRTFYDIDLDSLTYRKLDGRNKVLPARDMSGQYWDEELHKLK